MFENGKKPTGILVHERTFGNVQVNVWANRRNTGHYSFRISLKKITGCSHGKLEYSYAFRPCDLNSLQVALGDVAAWLENPTLIGESEEDEKMVLRLPSSPSEIFSPREEPNLKYPKDIFKKKRK